jgi:hypothetical protein
MHAQNIINRENNFIWQYEMLEYFQSQFPLERKLETRDDWLQLRDAIAVHRHPIFMWMEDIQSSTIQASSYVFVPIHQKNHWSLLVIDMLRRKFFHLDSMWPPGSEIRADRLV